LRLPESDPQHSQSEHPIAVDELVLVRLGMKPDLKITGQLFDRFEALDRESALRLISRDPPDLARVLIRSLPGNCSTLHN